MNNPTTSDIKRFLMNEDASIGDIHNALHGCLDALTSKVLCLCKAGMIKRYEEDGTTIFYNDNK